MTRAQAPLGKWDLAAAGARGYNRGSRLRWSL